MLFKSKSRTKARQQAAINQAYRAGFAQGLRQTRRHLEHNLRGARYRESVLELVDRTPPTPGAAIPTRLATDYRPERHFPAQPHPRLVASKLYWWLPFLTGGIGILTAAGTGRWEILAGAAGIIALWATIGRGAATLRGVWCDLQQESLNRLHDDDYCAAYRQAWQDLRDYLADRPRDAVRHFCAADPQTRHTILMLFSIQQENRRQSNARRAQLYYHEISSGLARAKTAEQNGGQTADLKTHLLKSYYEVNAAAYAAAVRELCDQVCGKTDPEMDYIIDCLTQQPGPTDPN